MVTRKSKQRFGSVFALLVTTSLAVTACGPDPATDRPGDRLGSSGTGQGNQPFEMTPGGRTANFRATAGVLSLGTIPYDNLTLPLVNPSGTVIATETGVEPRSATVYAEADADTAPATRVELYRVLYTENRIEFFMELPEAVLLGRACDGHGFLVEQQLDDGSRRIGKASWETGAIEWLVDDGNVNAFATLGPNGQLAWSRRAPEAADLFDLVIRSRNGPDWTIGKDGECWVMPTWSGRGNGLFVMRINEGFLEMVYGTALDPASFQQSQRRIVLAKNGSVRQAHQVSIGQPQVHGLGIDPIAEQIIFVHPVHHRACLWRPTSSRGTTTILQFHRGSFTAVLDDRDHLLVPTAKSLYRQHSAAPKSETNLLRGTFIPRRTARTDYSYLLLTPGDGQLAVTAMRLVGQDEMQGRTQGRRR